jgi:hypothetical protein
MKLQSMPMGSRGANQPSRKIVIPVTWKFVLDGRSSRDRAGQRVERANCANDFFGAEFLEPILAERV